MGREACLTESLFGSSRSPYLLERPRMGQEKEIEFDLLRENLIRIPAPERIGSFLLIYLAVVVPLNYVIFRKIGKLEFAWLALPLLAALFSGAVFGFNYLTATHQMTVTSLNLLETRLGSTVGRDRTYFGIYSPAETSIHMTFGQSGMLPSSMLSGERLRGTDPDPIDYRFEAGKLEITRFPVRHQASRSLAGTATVDLGGRLEGEVTYDGETLHGSIGNHTRMGLHHLFLVRQGKAMALKDLPAGKSIEFRANAQSMDKDPAALAASFPDPVPPDRPDTSINNLMWRKGVSVLLPAPRNPNDENMRIMQQMPGQSRMNRWPPQQPSGTGDEDLDYEETYRNVTRGGLCLIGITEPLDFGIEANGVATPLHGSTFVLVRVSCKPAADQSIHFGPDFFTIQQAKADVVGLEKPRDGLTTLGWKDSTTFVLRPSGVDFDGLKIEGFNFHWESGSDTHGKYTVALYNHRTGAWIPYSDPGTTYSIKGWSQFLDPLSPQVVVRVSVNEEDDNNDAKLTIKELDPEIIARRE